MRRRTIGLWLAAALVLPIQACSHPERQPAVPDALTTKAEVPGLPGTRYWIDSDIGPFIKDAVESRKNEDAYLARAGHKGPVPTAHYLAISGGGDNGAFGAGLLVGWTEAGDRPEFKLVTGISTGALIAPFAYLGPDYDDELKAVYTTISGKDVLQKRGILAALTDDAMADNRPLRRLVEKYVDGDMLAKIAEEHEKGRILMVATTDLDARQPVVWNMGKIAASQDPKALDLFRSVLVASAAIPGAFPPVMIDVEVDGQPYQEMHVDGGTMAQVIIYPASLDILKEAKNRGITLRKRRLYVIRNARLDADWAAVDRQTLSILRRAIASLIQTQGKGDLYQIYAIAERDGVQYNLAYIPETFNAEHKEEFDTEYMRQLFDLAYQKARTGYPWKKKPPGFGNAGS